MRQPVLRHVTLGSVFGVAIAALALFGIWITSRATWVVTHGGDASLDRAFDYPIWAILHFVPALMFAVILPFQLWPGSRQRFPRIHRSAGRLAAIAGVFVSLTGLVLPYVMTARPLGERVFMTTFSCVFVILLASGVRAARRRDFDGHRRWMLRTTAIALGPLTQRILFPLFAAAGIDSMARFWDLFLTAAWLSGGINLVVAEWWIHRTTLRSLQGSPIPARAELATVSIYAGPATS